MAEGRAPREGAPRRADLFSVVVATGLGYGSSPFAARTSRAASRSPPLCPHPGPATAGSAVGLLLFWPLQARSAAIQVGALVILFFVGVVCSTRVARGVGLED